MKAIITLEDSEDGGVSMDIVFDSPAEAQEKSTYAQYAAIKAAEFIVNLSKATSGIRFEMDDEEDEE